MPDCDLMRIFKVEKNRIKASRNILLFLAFVFTPLWAQTPAVQSHLAIGLFASAHSQMLTFAFVQTREGKLIGSRIVGQTEFMYAAMGYYPNVVNLQKVNLFSTHGVDSCSLIYNEAGKVCGWEAPPFDSLWKIRFYENPYLFDQRGWSQGRITPSFVQRDYIRERYGVNNVTYEYFYGDTLYKLLRDVQDTVWIETYRTILPKLDTSASSTSP